MLSLIQKTKTEVLDVIFPKKCIGCNTLNTWICFDCFSRLIQESPVKRRINNLSVYACANYKNKILQKLINNFKYDGVIDLSIDGAKLLSSLYSVLIIDKVDLITSIPLHPKR